MRKLEEILPIQVSKSFKHKTDFSLSFFKLVVESGSEVDGDRKSWIGTGSKVVSKAD